MSESPLVLDFTDERCREVELSGGKGASLASMTQNGLPVPPGFVITSAAFAEAVDGEKLVGLISIGDLVKNIISEQQFIIEQLEQYITGGGR